MKLQTFFAIIIGLTAIALLRGDFFVCMAKLASVKDTVLVFPAPFKTTVDILQFMFRWVEII